MKCKHTNTVCGPAYGYTGSVNILPYTHENRCAHGAVRFTESCTDCGATRAVNSNGRHREYAPWDLRVGNSYSPTPAEVTQGEQFDDKLAMFRAEY